MSFSNKKINFSGSNIINGSEVRVGSGLAWLSGWAADYIRIGRTLRALAEVITIGSLWHRDRGPAANIAVGDREGHRRAIPRETAWIVEVAGTWHLLVGQRFWLLTDDFIFFLFSYFHLYIPHFPNQLPISLSFSTSFISTHHIFFNFFHFFFKLKNSESWWRDIELFN